MEQSEYLSRHLPTKKNALPNTPANKTQFDKPESNLMTVQVKQVHRLSVKAKEYLKQLYGLPGQGNDADKWMEHFGLLCGFIDEQFTPTISLDYDRLPTQTVR